ncbi:MAG: hypothetical protein GC192_04430 [Bacteroidetes bacterium]|nr:hypothetical protein [Bacteroidota bacterium]
MDNIEAKVKELVTDFKLEEALDVLIAQAQTQTQRKQNALLVLKGKLAMLEEQNLTGMLSSEDVARQKAAIAHQILDIADGSPLDYDPPAPTANEPSVSVQKTVSIPNNSGSMAKYLLLGALLLAALIAVFYFAKNSSNPADKTAQNQTEETTNPTANDSDKGQTVPSQDTNDEFDTSGDLKVMDFPSYRKKFKFLDFIYDFQDVKAETYSDTETKLTIRYSLKCKSNLGVCYRVIPRVIANDLEIGPSYQLSTAGWVAHDSTIIDELSFVIPNNTTSYYFELLRDGSTWKRAFKILQ